MSTAHGQVANPAAAAIPHALSNLFILVWFPSVDGARSSG
jgi:hypothetical protein